MRAALALVLAEVAAGNVTWRDSRTFHVHRRSTFRLWTSEHEYRLVTKQGHELHAAGLVKCERASGYTFAAFGPVELTPLGRQQLPSGG